MKNGPLEVGDDESDGCLPTFGETVQLTNEWLNDLMTRVDWEDRQRAYRLLRSTLHALRDRLTPEEAVHHGR